MYTCGIENVRYVFYKTWKLSRYIHMRISIKNVTSECCQLVD